MLTLFPTLNTHSLVYKTAQKYYLKDGVVGHIFIPTEKCVEEKIRVYPKIHSDVGDSDGELFENCGATQSIAGQKIRNIADCF